MRGRGRKYMRFQRGEGGRKYMRFQRGEGLSTLMINPGINPIRQRRRRLRQRGRGIGSILRTVGTLGKRVINNPLVRKFAKDVILPTALGAVRERINRQRQRRV